MTQDATLKLTGLRTMGLVLCIALAAIYIWLAARSFQASRLASSLDVASLQRAIGLEPGNAAYQDLLCRFLLFDRQEASAALPLCQRATELNPYNSAYWLDLALAQYSVGGEAEQQAAILKAVSVDPTTPDVAWTAANFFLAQGEVSEALPHFAVAMRGDPNLVAPSLDLLWRTAHDVNAIEPILPAKPEAYLQFVRLLISKNEWDRAQQVWIAMLALNKEVDYRRALFYVDGLLEQRNITRAHDAWEQLASRAPVLDGYSRTDSLVMNGGFEKQILNAGFDWRYSPQTGSAVSLDVAEPHDGSQSLMVSYKGVSGDSGLLQYVPVQPDTRYTVSAWARSERLESANGPLLTVSDAYNGKVYARTAETLGTTQWHLVESSFQTGSESQLVAIRLSRDPGGTLVKGKFWLDDVSLRPDPEPSRTHE